MIRKKELMERICTLELAKEETNWYLEDLTKKLKKLTSEIKQLKTPEKKPTKKTKKEC